MDLSRTISGDGTATLVPGSACVEPTASVQCFPNVVPLRTFQGGEAPQVIVESLTATLQRVDGGT